MLYDNLEITYDQSDGGKSLMNKMRTAEAPTLPYPGFFMKKFTYAGELPKLSKKYVNLERYEIFEKIILSFNEARSKSKYEYEIDMSLISYINSMTLADDKDLMKISTKIHPRGKSGKRRVLNLYWT